MLTYPLTLNPFANASSVTTASLSNESPILQFVFFLQNVSLAAVKIAISSVYGEAEGGWVERRFKRAVRPIGFGMSTG